jgi:hypothetical protein
MKRFVTGQISVFAALQCFIYILRIDVTSFQFHSNTYDCKNNNNQRRCRQHHGHQTSLWWLVPEQKKVVYPLLNLVPNTVELTTERHDCCTRYDNNNSNANHISICTAKTTLTKTKTCTSDESLL